MNNQYFKPATSLGLVSLVLLIAICFSSLAHSVQVTATVDRNDISIEETLNLKIRYQGKTQSNIPKLDDLEKNFEIISQSRSNQFRSLNGQVEAWVEWSLVIAPKRQGELLIPSFNLDGVFTDPIEINVSDAKAVNLADGTAKDIFLETEIDQQEVFVQQQVLLTLRLNTSLPVASINQRETLELPEAKVEEVSEQRYNRNINGRDYAVLELVFAIYPQESGTLEIPVMTWEANIGNRSSSLFDIYSRQNSLRRLRSEAQTVTVKPKPAAYRGTHWLPATQMVLSDDWSDGFPDFVQGEPITRSITLSADGLTASQLPNLETNYPDGVNQYPESPQVDEQKSAKGIVTNSLQTQALLVTEPGDYTLPSVTLSWWNTNTDQEEIIELPARKIKVKASPATAAPPPIINLDPQPVTTEEPAVTTELKKTGIGWALLIGSNILTAAIILAGAWYFFIGRAKTVTSANPVTNVAKTPKAILKQLQLDCDDRDSKRTRETLLKLSRYYFPEQSASLSKLTSISQEPTFIQAVADLDQKLFQGNANGDVNFEDIFSGANNLRFPKSNPDANNLLPLNPTTSHP